MALDSSAVNDRQGCARHDQQDVNFLLHGRLQRQAQPWQDRLQVLLFGVLHVRGLSA